MKEGEVKWINPEFPGEKSALVFDHSHKGTVQRLSVYAWKAGDEDGKKWENDFIGINIEDEERNPIGTIDGELLVEGQEITFYTYTISNNRRDGKEEKKVPRAIGASIANLLISGVIDKWESSSKETLSVHAVEMYEKYLAANEALRVIHPLKLVDSYGVKKAWG